MQERQRGSTPTSDLELQRAIVAALERNPVVHPDEISVDVVDGDVALRGTVGSLLQRAEAGDTASGVPGIHSLDNGLQVEIMGVDGRADADTEAAVLDALAAQHLLDGAEVDVEVRAGTVTLTGGVELASQRAEIVRVVHGVPGVSHVVNHLHVWLGLTSDEVLRRVREAILALDRFAVQIDDNDVTLTGTVSSPEHRATVLAAASATPGVATVHDELTVASPAVRHGSV